ncbi:MAG: amidase family protein [Oscillospiraceae bacterium]|nr:amidase family protein [Oscillospiraceae bacterium]
MKIAVDENIFIKGEICAAGSKMLYNFKAPYSATVINKLKAAQMTISCRTKTGEFGGRPPKKESAADAVASGLADAALGIDSGGGAYRLAAGSGVVYIKPTYGTVSRFGLAANVSSVDQIGVYAKNFGDGFYALSAVSGHDANDPLTYPAEKYEYDAKKIDANQLKVFETDIDAFKYRDCLEPVYLIVSAAEFYSNTSKFDGLKYGYRTENFKDLNDMVINSRSEAFSAETKLKTLMGAYVLSEGQFEKYYYKAAQIRRLIKEELAVWFESFDIVTLPLSDESAALANLTGCPAVIAKEKIMIAKEFDENKLFAIGREG